MAIELEDRGGGVFAAHGARLIDRSGRRRLPIGDDGFVTAMLKAFLVTLEVKFSRDAGEAELTALAREALVQIAARGYDADLPAAADERLRWGVAFSGKRVAVACEHVEATGGPRSQPPTPTSQN